MTDSLQALFKNNEEKMTEDFLEFLRFQSISADSEFNPQTLACADWVENYLKESKLDVERFETSGFPIFLASWLKAGPDKPTILIYNHYDVQPVDPINLWESKPFEPEIRDGQVYARGATDNKGPCLYVMAAIRALLEAEGELPVNVKLIIEGEEESGSESFEPVLTEHKEKLSADYVLIVDVGVHSLDRPSVTVGTRGLVATEVTFKGSAVDLHSGSFGGLAYNPLHALIEVISKMRSPEGEILIPGFYENVERLSPEEKSEIDFSFDANMLKEKMGLECEGGEKAFSPLESAWLRPTLEINGIAGGYAGEGFKTVIPAEATAKISCRLSPGQDVNRIAKLIGEFITENTPAGIESEFKMFPGGGVAVRTSPNSDLVRTCQQAISEITELPCSIILDGASIPVAPALTETAGGEISFIGYMLPDDYLHAPNEHFGLDRMRLGFLTICRLLGLLGKEK